MSMSGIELVFQRGWFSLLVSGLVLLSGCRKADDTAVGTSPAAVGASPSAVAEAASPVLLAKGAEGSLPEDEATVDQFAPVAPEGADDQLKKLSENERDLVRTLVVMQRQRSEIEQKAITENEEVRASHERMNEARRDYLETLQSLPEIRHIDKQLELMRKRLSETSNLRQKMSGRAEP